MKRETLKDRIARRIKRSDRKVFLRSDFRKFAGYDQVGRALRLLVAEGKLMKIGYGLYAKARINPLTEKPMLDANGGFDQVAKEALKRLGVAWDKTDAVRAYEQGSLQMPMKSEVVILDRFSRQIGTDKFQLGMIRT